MEMQPIPTADEDPSDDGEHDAWLSRAASAPPAPRRSRLARFWTRNILPDGYEGRWCGVDVAIPEIHGRLAKFLALTYGGIALATAWIRTHEDAVTWERDESYDLGTFALYDLHAVALDSLWFFVVGRLWRRPGVDRLAFLGPCSLGVYAFSRAGGLAFTRHSISLYQVRCSWPPALFFLVGGIIALVSALVGLHVRGARREGFLVGRLTEIAVTVAVFWLPRAGDANFHVHHWFLAWFIGQHANQNALWSVASCGLLWGGYLNGIAAYGRDDPLGCKASFYAARNQGCGYLECFYDRFVVIDPATNATERLEVAFAPPDWRHCGAEGNYSP